MDVSDEQVARDDRSSVRVEADPLSCYQLVADITQMGRLSTECTGGRWLGRTRTAVEGARFVGFNRRGRVRWATLNRVVVAEPGSEFSFETSSSGARWSYTFCPDGDGTLVTESRELVGERPLSAKLFSRFLLGGTEEHDEEMRAALSSTLERLKELAESR